MKKRIFMLLMAMVIMLGMSLTAFADQTEYYEGEGFYYRESDDLIQYDMPVNAICVGDQLSGESTAVNGDYIEFWGTLNTSYETSVNETNEIRISINGIMADYISAVVSEDGDDIYWISKGVINGKAFAFQVTLTQLLNQ